MKFYPLKNLHIQDHTSYNLLKIHREGHILNGSKNKQTNSSNKKLKLIPAP